MGKIRTSKIIFVINKKSGSSFLIDKLLLDLTDFIKKKYINIEVVEIGLQEIESLEKYCSQFDEKSVLFVACGGDGTVTYLAESIYKSTIENYLTVIPFGTGNDFSREIGTHDIKNNIEALAKCFLGDDDHNMFCEIPLWSFNQKVFLNYLSIGYDAQVASDFDRYRSSLPAFFNRPFFNKCIYGISGFFNTLAGIKKDSIELKLHEKIVSLGKLKLLIVSNINSYAGGYRLGDEKVALKNSLMILKIPSLLSFAKIFFGNGWYKSKIEEISDFELKINKNCYAQLDGEPFQMAVGKYEVKLLGKILVLGWKNEI
ncbi:MAG: hypothetical protein COA79_18325 [Planctomycetota bacterium]|nr:MAG: hypothetical protein COA79_18325 [Planctomycetota bacterium]